MNVAVNIIVTFFQAALAVWATSGFALDKLTLGAVVGAGASGVWNLVIKPILVKQGWLK